MIFFIKCSILLLSLAWVAKNVNVSRLWVVRAISNPDGKY